MGKKTTLEQAYFHIDNGGITFKIVEETSERESSRYASDGTMRVVGIETKYNRRWYFEVRTSHFGSGVNFRFPLGNLVMVAWTIDALKRVMERMAADTGKPTDGFEFAFRELRRASVGYLGGNKVDFKFPPNMPVDDQDHEYHGSPVTDSKHEYFQGQESSETDSKDSG